MNLFWLALLHQLHSLSEHFVQFLMSHITSSRSKRDLLLHASLVHHCICWRDTTTICVNCILSVVLWCYTLGSLIDSLLKHFFLCRWTIIHDLNCWCPTILLLIKLLILLDFRLFAALSMTSIVGTLEYWSFFILDSWRKLLSRLVSISSRL